MKNVLTQVKEIIRIATGDYVAEPNCYLNLKTIKVNISCIDNNCPFDSFSNVWCGLPKSDILRDMKLFMENI